MEDFALSVLFAMEVSCGEVILPWGLSKPKTRSSIPLVTRIPYKGNESNTYALEFLLDSCYFSNNYFEMCVGGVYKGGHLL
jgi:hypothetical protein